MTLGLWDHLCNWRREEGEGETAEYKGGRRRQV